MGAHGSPEHKGVGFDILTFLWQYVFMRTTLDLPDEMLREAKAKAALEGATLKTLLTRYIENGLRQMPEPNRHRNQRSRLPVIPRRGKHAIPNLTPEFQAQLEEQEDRAKLDRSFGR